MRPVPDCESNQRPICECDQCPIVNPTNALLGNSSSSHNAATLLEDSPLFRGVGTGWYMNAKFTEKLI